EIVIEPQGHDPDDNDDLYYRYEGWKQDYDEFFDPSCCNEINPGSSIICKEEPWECVREAPAPSLQDCMDDHTQQDLNTWTTSELYQPDSGDPSDTDTYRRANYITKTTKDGAESEQEDENPVYYPCTKDPDTGEWEGTPYSRDLGPHNVTVKVCDTHGKCDWQSVLIMVTDIPRPVIETGNDYGTGEASLEDPFILDASKSNIFSVVESYTWKSMVSGSAIPEFDLTVPYSETQNGRLKIPHPFSDYDIYSIKGADNFFQETGSRELSLTIGSQTETMDIEVKECIPYSGSDSPYPYNPDETDPFMADHSCCDSDGTYLDSSANCYEDGEYGSIKALGTSSYTEGDPTLDSYPSYWHLESGTTQDKPSLTSQYGNDLFYREFSRYCSGDRGNICAGNAEEYMTVKEECLDWEYDWQDERCQGPTSGIAETGSEAHCINYAAGETFESEEGVGTGSGQADGYCSDTPRCTDGEDYTADGPFLCQKAVCDGSGHCTKPFTQGSLECSCTQSCGASNQCTIFSHEDLSGGGKCLPDGSGFCTSLCSFKAPDESAEACACSGNEWNAGEADDTEINVDSALCCGNDPSEHYIKNPFDESDDACCDNKDASGNEFSGDECVYNGRCMDTEIKPEICDGKDNDCDGVIDNNVGFNAPLNTNQEGVCQGSKRSCGGASGWVDDYSGIEDYQTTETKCDDGLDNDCDGKTDCDDSSCNSAPNCQA
ncbi:MAG: hypothetical protein R6U32_07065, partial [Candidatus Woesearchaeota archaeon]